MALSAEQKDEILTMHRNGIDPKEIASFAVEKFGCRPIAAYGLINQEKWKADPSSRPANTGRPRKIKETVTRETTTDEPEVFSGHGQGSVVSSAPLFSGMPGIIARVEVTRIHAMPRHAGVGVVGEIDPDAFASDLQAIYGGGRYFLKAFDSTGKPVRTTSVTLAGRSIPIDPDVLSGQGENPAMFYPPQQNNLETMLMQLLMREKQEDRISVEDRMAMERERARIDREERERRERSDREDRERWNTQQMQMMDKSHAHQLQIVTQAMQGKQGGMAETLTLLTTAKDLFDGGDSGDTTTELVKMVPKALDSIKGLASMRQVQAVPNPQGGAAQQVSLDQAQQALFQALVAQGLTEEEAGKALARAGEFLQNKVMEKQQQAKAAAPVVRTQAKPVTPSPPPAGAVAAAPSPAQVPANGQGKPVAVTQGQQVPNPGEAQA